MQTDLIRETTSPDRTSVGRTFLLTGTGTAWTFSPGLNRADWAVGPPHPVILPMLKSARTCTGHAWL